MTSASGQSDRAAAAPDWAAIRHAYVSQGVAVRDICRSHGIHSQTLYRRAGQEAWPRRRESRNTAEERKTSRLLARLRRIAEGQIDEIEARRTTRTETLPGVPKCDAPALTALVKLMEHIAAIESKHQVTRDGTRDGTGEKSQADRARRRAELANKLIAMLEQERGAPLPEGHVG